MRRVLIALLLLLATLVPAGILIAGDSTEPGQPEWVDAAGVVDPNRVPSELAVAGPDGKPVVCANGRQLRVTKADLFGPPPRSPRVVGTSAGDLVWRCGSGKNPHLHPRLVPESEDPLRQGDG
jgi:hypothetical protein